MELNTTLSPASLDRFSQWRVAEPRVASDADYAECRAIMQAASKNYSFASAFLPAGKLRHVEALYALMRVGDDRVDVAHTGFDNPLDAIDEWECAYNSAFEVGESPYPVLRAYLRTAQECGIPQAVMNDYFRAMRDDLSVTRFPTFDHLLHYMAGSAIPVGRAMTYILGVRQPYAIEEALPGADALSIAMQLSNFWRDVGYDWRIGRVYLPQEDMQRFGVSEEQLALGKVAPELVELLEFEFERTEAYYRQARQAVALLAEGRWAVMSALEVYRAIIPGIRRNRYDVFNYKAGTSKWQKLSLAARAWWRSR
jgi:phytoene synthase